jgi:beta-N-acetylhexosaminidase
MSRILIGLSGTTLSEQEGRWLARPDVAGVVQFGRNFESADQFVSLNGAIREIDDQALICIDQEGGRVQRIGAPCTPLPALGDIGQTWDADPDEALELTFRHAWLMASEMLALGLDMSFAPVLDLDRGSAVIGNRAFHAENEVVKELGRAYIKGMHEAGMAACGKHFPGHGFVAADTHDEVARDDRELDDIAIEDLRPYSVALRHGLDAIMMAHVIYPRVCPQPAGYSLAWCQQMLRQRMAFEGVIISDDLGMRAAADVGDFDQRYRASLAAGCDLVLVCRPGDVAQAMSEIAPSEAEPSTARNQLLASSRPEWETFAHSPDREMAQIVLESLED